MGVPATNTVDRLNAIEDMVPIECGKDAAKHFLFKQNWRNLNHGSFGTYPQEIRNVMRQFQDESELNPDKFIRYDFPRHNDEARSVVAELLNAPSEGIVFVSNATLGINTILRNLVYKPGDVIIYFSTIYGSCYKTIEYLMETTPLRSKGIHYTYPCTDTSLCSAFEQAITSIRAAGLNPKIAIFDTIVALPGVRMPFERLTAICRAQNILSCIDGAHSIGQIPIDMSALDPDFYVSNCHKWLFTPRGCCVLYVPLRNQPLMRSTLPTSHGFVPRVREGGELMINPLPPSEKSEFVNNFEFVGTLDNAPYMCVPAAVAWRRKVRYGQLRGEEAIMRYCVDLAVRGGKKVAEELGTWVLGGTLGMCAFANVRLPVEIADYAEGVKVAQWIERTLVKEYDTFIAMFIHDGMLWARLSTQIYLTIEDFEWAGRTLKEVCSRARDGKWKQAAQETKL